MLSQIYDGIETSIHVRKCIESMLEGQGVDRSNWLEVVGTGRAWS